jgi:hypothetical protein
MASSHGIIAWHHRMASSHGIIVCEDITRTVTPFSVHTCPYPYIHDWVQREERIPGVGGLCRRTTSGVREGGGGGGSHHLIDKSRPVSTSFQVSRCPPVGRTPTPGSWILLDVAACRAVQFAPTSTPGHGMGSCSSTWRYGVTRTRLRTKQSQHRLGDPLQRKPPVSWICSPRNWPHFQV